MVGYGPDNRIRSSRSIFMSGRLTDEVLAAASGTFLKGIVEIREDVGVPIGGVMRTASFAVDAMEKTATSIAPGEVSVTATVTITYGI